MKDSSNTILLFYIKIIYNKTPGDDIMLDLTFTEEDSKNFIKDINQDDKQITITYGDDRVVIDSQSTLHNMNRYRYLMQEQFSRFSHRYEIELGKEFIKNKLKRFLSIIIDITAIYFNVTMNPNIVLKIIATVLLVAGELAYFWWNKLGDYVLDQDAEEILTTEYYLENKSTFEYYSDGLKEFRHLIPIEQISRFKITKSDLERIKLEIERFKREHIPLDEMQIALTKKPKQTV